MSVAPASYRRIVKSTSIVGGASVVNIVVGLVRSKALAVMLGPAGVGLTSLFTGLLGTASTVAAMGLGAVGTRQIAEAYGKADTHTVEVARRALFCATLALSVAGGAMVWLLRSSIAAHALGSASYAGSVGWLAVGVALSVASASQGALIQGMRRIGDIARLNVLSAAISAVLGVAFLWRWGSAGILPFVLALPLATFVMGRFYVSRLPKAGAGPVSWAEMTREWKILFRLGVAMVAAGVVGQLAQLWIRVDLANVLGAQSLGQYQAAWTVSQQYVAFVLTAMGMDYYPRLTGVIHDRQAACRLVNQQTEIAILLSAPVLIATISMAPLAIHLLYAQSFTPAVEILRWQVLGDVLKVASWPLGFLILAQGDGSMFFLCEAGFWMIVSALILGLAPTLGLRIGGVAYLVSYAIYLPLVYFLARRRFGFRWSKFASATIALSFLISALGGALATWSFWGQAIGCAAAALSALFSLLRIARMSNLGPSTSRLSMLANRILWRREAVHD